MTDSPTRRILLLTNPAARGGHAESAGRRAAARLRARGVDVITRTAADQAATHVLVEEAVQRGLDAVAVVGGDGMVNLALQALAGTSVPLGVIPTGTGNDHAREYGLPRRDPAAAADVIANGSTRRIDLGRVETADGTVRYFGTVLSSGFDSLVTDRANRLPWPRGRARYNLAMLVEFARMRPLRFRVTLDDDAVIEADLLAATAGNTRSYGGGMLICPGADPADGLLDLTMVHAMSRRRVARFFPTVYRGTHVRFPEVETHRAASVHIESPGMTAYADGEYIGPLPIRLTVAPAALSVIVPAEM